jgi:hypothetical protein
MYVPESARGISAIPVLLLRALAYIFPRESTRIREASLMGWSAVSRTVTAIAWAFASPVRAISANRAGNSNRSWITQLRRGMAGRYTKGARGFPALLFRREASGNGLGLSFLSCCGYNTWLDWTGVRVAEGAGLENRYTGNGIVGSNPTLSVCERSEQRQAIGTIVNRLSRSRCSLPFKWDRWPNRLRRTPAS